MSTGRAESWVEAFQDMAALQLAHRLIVAGCEVTAERGALDVVAVREIKQMILDTMVIDYTDVTALCARLEGAVLAARQVISPGLRKEVEGWALRDMPWCYLCGGDLDFGGSAYDACTLDHVWPRSYGGDSEFENLLPACQACNGRKGSTPAWALYPVQALVAGFRLLDSELDEMPKEMRFSARTRAAAQLAAGKGVSLRDGFVALGRPNSIAVIDAATSVDVFNLRIDAGVGAAV